MNWNDTIIMIACFGLSSGLLPMIWSKNKAPKWTCFVCGISQAALTGVMFNIDFVAAAVANAIITLVWWTVFFQKRN